MWTLCEVLFQDFMPSKSFIYSLSAIFKKISAAILWYFIILPHLYPITQLYLLQRYYNIIFFQCSNNKNKNVSDTFIYLLYSHFRIKENQAIITSNDKSELYFFAIFLHFLLQVSSVIINEAFVCKNSMVTHSTILKTIIAGCHTRC